MYREFIQQGLLVIGGVTAFSASAADEPIVVQDGSQVPVENVGGESSPVLSFLNTLSPNDIDYIRVLTGPEGATYGLRGGHGVIEIHTANKLKNYASTNGIKAIINFFTADMPAIYVVTVTGITATGNNICKTITISRK